MTQVQHNRRTSQLLSLLAADGFQADDQMPFVQDGEGYVEHPATGIWIHAGDDMIRLIVPDDRDLPPYRLTLGMRELTDVDAIRIIAVHARAALVRRGI